MGRWATWAFCACLSGCGFNSAGNCGSGGSLPSCIATKSRSFEPLGAGSAYSSHTTLAPAGTQTAVVWEVGDPAPSSTGQLYAALVNDAGVVGSARLLVPGGMNPALFRIGNQLTLFWRQGSAIEMQLVDDTGTLLNQPVTVFQGTGEWFAIDWSGSDWGLLISGANGDAYQLYWLRLASDGTVAAGPTKLAQAGKNSLQPALVWNGCSYLAAWTDLRSGTPVVYFARFARDFTRLGDDLPVSDPSFRGSFPTLASQASGGTLLCYEQLVNAPLNQEVFCTRLDSSGQITGVRQLSSTPLPSDSPHLVPHGRDTWLLWDDYVLSQTVPNIVWQFLDENGAPLLDQPASDPMIAPGGFRPHGYATADALIFTQYYGDPASGMVTTHIVSENCY